MFKTIERAVGKVVKLAVGMRLGRMNGRTPGADAPG